MATNTPAVFEAAGDGSVQRYIYSAMANGDVGGAIQSVAWADRSVQVSGTFGAGGTVVIEGSNDGGTTWQTLNDPSSTALSFTAAKTKAILELTEQVRPHVTGGDGTTSLTVAIIVRRAQPLRV